MRYCSKCGNAADTDARFCPYCGNEFKAENVDNTPDSAAAQTMTAEPVYAQAPVQQAQVQQTPGTSSTKGKVFGIIGFVLGLSAIVCCWLPICNYIALPAAIVGLIFCNISRKNMTFKLANVGKTLSIIALIFSIITIIVYTILMVLGIADLSQADPDAIQAIIDQLHNEGIDVTIHW